MELPLQRYWDLLTHYLEPIRLRVGLLAVLIFLTIGLQLVNPQIIRYFIDTALATGVDESATQSLILAALLFLLAALLQQGVNVAATYVGEDVGWLATNQLRGDVARHCLHLDMSFHNEHTPGAMIERVDSDIVDIAVFFSRFVIRILGNLLLIVGVLVVLAWEDWRISVALATYICLALAGLVYMRHIAVPYWKDARQASADLFGFLEEQLSGTEDIRSSGGIGYVIRNLFKFSYIHYRKEFTGRTMSFLVIIMWTAMYTLGQTVAFVSSYLLFQRGLLSVGAVFLVVYYTDIIFRPLNEITREIQNLQKAAAGIERVDSLLSLQSKIVDEGRQPLPPGALGVAFEHVTFGYADAEPVLHDISFQVPAGRVLGLLGRTGSGKTTMTRLLFRLYDPSTGAIQLGKIANGAIHLGGDTISNSARNPAGNGLENAVENPGINSSNGHALAPIRNINQVAIDTLRQRIGMVTQDVQLFRASVRDNLTLFDRTISDTQLREVIEALELGAWFNALPDGLDTALATEGASLSAGEAQLLAFTRVFLKNPGLVVLDEASSRLDPATEQLIERAVDKLLRNRTGIIIAHRLSTVQRADYIMILEQGHIVEFGDRRQLAGDPTSRFYSLLQTGLQEVLV